MIKKYKGLEYIVFMEHFNHCGYVKLPENHPYQKFVGKKKKAFGQTLYIGYDLMDIFCHGGLTFTRKITKQNQNNFPQGFSLGSWIGWDYGHYGDYMSIFPQFKGKIWNEKEITKECKNVIKQLLLKK